MSADHLIPLESRTAPASRPAPWWTPGQLLFVGLQLVVVLSAVGGLLIFMPDDLRILWTHPLGQKMLAAAAVMLVGNFGAFLLIAGLLNRFLPPRYPDSTVWRIAIQAIVGLILIAFLFLPVLYVLFVGPAAIRISDGLIRPP